MTVLVGRAAISRGTAPAYASIFVAEWVQTGRDSLLKRVG
jgi:hypothetical protein